jgi:crotonobetainyl-CoA:carnitine CoA-transferase CaiB-like acyl-CoA transferase
LLCMAIFDVADISASPHLAARGFWSEVEVDGSPVRIPGRYAKVPGEQVPRVRRRAPRLDEHRAEILTEWTGAAR